MVVCRQPENGCAGDAVFGLSLVSPPRIRSPIYIYSDPIIFTPGLTSKDSQVLGFAIPSFRFYKWVTIEI